MTLDTDRITKTIRAANEVFLIASKKTKILFALSWEKNVAEDFFKSQESKLPEPVYRVNRDELNGVLVMLESVKPKLIGQHPVFQWLMKTHESMVNGTKLLLNIGKRGFYDLSSELYGNSNSCFFDGLTSSSQLADSLSKRLSSDPLARKDNGASLSSLNADEFSVLLKAKLKNRNPYLPVKVELTDGIVSKVAAGMNRVRIRKDARFSPFDVLSLWNHEIESHCLTAHNGNLQDGCHFLFSGGPRTTLTQEGLAVFFEMYGHSMTQERLLNLCDRVLAIKKVEEGANFMEVYRWYKDRSEVPMDAFYQTQRIFRGAGLNGGEAFTKDVVYLAGLLGVYNFLRIAVKNQNRQLIESLVCGRIALEDVGIVAWLRSQGILKGPHFEPPWLKNWESLLCFFSFSAFLDGINLPNFQNYFDKLTRQNWDFDL